MSKYFKLTYLNDFQPYTASHLTVLFLVTLFCISIFVFRKRMKLHSISAAAHIVMAVILILCELTLQLWFLSTGIWSVKRSLPLHLCGISLLLCAFMLISGSKRVYEIAFFWGVGGAVQALLTPNTDYSFPHYVFFEFFTAHSFIVISCLWVTFVDRYRPRFRSVWKAVLAINLYALIIFGVNRLTGGNYLFISHKPSTPSLMDYLGPWPWYIVSLEAVAVILFLILYLPFAVSGRIANSKRKSETKFFSGVMPEERAEAIYAGRK